MKAIEALERPENHHTEDRTRGWWACHKAYTEAVKRDYDAPIFNEVVWDETIPDIVKELRANEVERFVITVSQAGIADILDLFQRGGCYLAGVCRVPTLHTIYSPNEGRNVPKFDNGFSLLVKEAPDPHLSPATQRVEVMLTDHELERLTEIANERDATPAEILAAFASDLTIGERTGGSDERMYADEWLHRRCDWGC